MDTRNKLFGIFWGGIVFVATFILTYKLTMTPNSDYQGHMEVARTINLSNIWSNAYPMWHLLVKLVYVILYYTVGEQMEWSASFVSAVINLVVFEMINSLFAREKIKGHSFYSFILMFVTPIYIPRFNPSLYLGQGSPNTWHNPTNLMVKPFAIAVFFMIVTLLEQIENKNKIQPGKWGVLALLLFLSTLAKPSFVQGMIPALGIFLIIKCVANKYCHIREYLLLCSCFIPAVIWLVYQFIWAFYSDGEGGIGISWLLVWGVSSPNVWISTILVLAFPLMYILFHVRRLVTCMDIQLSFILVCVTWLEYALLYEKGSRIWHGNMGWSLLLAYSVFWIVSVIHYAKDVTKMLGDKTLSVKNVCLGCVMLVHFICGCYYWSYLLTNAAACY
jgi:hypothetical protein